MSIRSITRALAGLGLCAAALTAAAGPYSGLVVFGDSLSDSGNNALLLSNFGTQPLPPVVVADDASYSRIPSAAGTYSNGMVWTQYLAQSLGAKQTTVIRYLFQKSTITPSLVSIFNSLLLPSEE